MTSHRFQLNPVDTDSPGDFQVLVVDDDPVVGRVVECVLDDMCNCHLVSSGLEAYSSAVELQPDLILLDVMLPGMNGYDICQHLKEDPSTASIPVIFLTSRKDFHDERMGLRLGAVDYLNKPVTPDLLRLRIRNQLKATAGIRQLHRESRQDALTGIGNRRVFDDALQNSLNLVVQKQVPLSLVLLDLDYFKQYNDHFGHWAGDQVLKQVAAEIRDFASRYSGLVTRYGGEEFAILFMGLLPEELEKAMQQTCRLIEGLDIQNPKAPAGPGVITASLGGVYLAPGFYSTPRHLIIEADQMLYSVKHQGRNHCRLKKAAAVEGPCEA
ncbi:diguanylate cyclase domain-containing protein [Marinospirillum sp.]|uniref:GGDEF domain-containing protein n=1 Tax=Marinospirillum sp. TaxID=2183934 RepID=UPI0028704A0D|nr:diguanylate cyclase [Marinospirillum sp.]MDR9467946.1 diguanylate cyclase [Marinospirillum sp.]